MIYAIVTNGLGMGKPIDFSIVANAAWFGMPHFTAPVFNAQAMTLLAPIAVILVAENLGHIKAVSAMTGQNLDRYVGRAFHRRRSRDDRLGLRRRHRRDDLRGKHRRDGRDENLLDAGVRDRRA